MSIMNKKDFKLFDKAIKLINNDFYVDAIQVLRELHDQTDDDDIKDDILYDIGLCYFKINDFNDAIIYFERVIDEYPNGIIKNSFNENESGKIKDKCLYALINCLLSIDNLKLAEKKFNEFDEKNNSYVIDVNGIKKSFKVLAMELIKKYKEL